MRESKSGLLSSVRKYKTTILTDSVENFITEAFAWILNNTSFKATFLDYLYQELKKNGYYPPEPYAANNDFETQVRKNKYFLDMTYRLGENTERPRFIFEHKIWSGLSHNQLKNYKESNSYIILIKADSQNNEEGANLTLCWYNIYYLIEKFLDNNLCKDEKELFLLNDFNILLEEEGLGPKKAIQEKSIKAYNDGIALIDQIKSLRSYIKNDTDFLQRLSAFNPDALTETGGSLIEKNREGCIGFELYNHWRPGIFVGFIIDASDHQIPPTKRGPPYLSIVLSLDREAQEICEKSSEYIQLFNTLENELPEWSVSDTFKELKGNKWHPLCINKSMETVFKDKNNFFDQKNIFIKEICDVLKILHENDHFIQLRKILNNIKDNQD